MLNGFRTDNAIAKNWYGAVEGLKMSRVIHPKPGHIYIIPYKFVY